MSPNIRIVGQYIEHIFFLATDTFQVTELATDSDLGNTVDILLIGGGGGGGGGNGDYGSGGGGAGGFVEVTGYTVSHLSNYYWRWWKSRYGWISTELF